MAQGERGRVDVEAERVDIDVLEPQEALGADAVFNVIFLRLKGVKYLRMTMMTCREVEREEFCFDRSELSVAKKKKAKETKIVPDAREDGAGLLDDVAVVRREVGSRARLFLSTRERGNERR